jgi:hypothetical protein
MLTWDQAIAQFAQNRAAWQLSQQTKSSTGCPPLNHDGRQNYGENLAMGTVEADGIGKTIVRLAGLWVNEGLPPSGTFNHFTQMVWGKTKLIGCGYAVSSRPDCMNVAYLACNCTS